MLLTVPSDLLISPSTVDVPTIPRSIISAQHVLFLMHTDEICIPKALSEVEVLSRLRRMFRRKEEEQTHKVLVNL